jgi:Tub family
MSAVTATLMVPEQIVGTAIPINADASTEPANSANPLNDVENSAELENHGLANVGVLAVEMVSNAHSEKAADNDTSNAVDSYSINNFDTGNLSNVDAPVAEDDRSKAHAETSIVKEVPSHFIEEFDLGETHNTKTVESVDTATEKKQDDEHHSASEEEPNPQQQSPNIQSLPLDALHGIASFLTPKEWCHHFGVLNTVTHMHCRTILQRVYMHAFKCATEVITAWKLFEQWEDAHELAALYIRAGVPIYPYCLGHAYQTIHWRMNVEASETLQQNRSETNDHLETPANRSVADALGGTNGISLPPSAPSSLGDPFFGAARIRHRLGRECTYLEEKCQFYLQHSSPPDRASRPTSFRSFSNASASARSPTPLMVQRQSSNPSLLENNAFKVPVVIHQHLYDRHTILHESYVDTLDSKMATPAINLSADFFHPSPPKKAVIRPQVKIGQTKVTEDVPDIAPLEPLLPPGVDDPDNNSAPPGVLTNRDVASASLLVSTNPEDESSDLAPLLLDEEQDNVAAMTSALSSVNLDVYSSTMTSSTGSSYSSTNTKFPEVRRYLSLRFATYQRRLEVYLLKGDAYSYEECMLDFWDEFFPHTCGIHYHDMETAVPRISCMHQFLTKPCPKSIGVVQCEIERIKITARGKGVKGRLFPTYEYRLFIRHNPLPHQMELVDEPAAEENPPSELNYRVSKDFVRRDTVLMVAKNRGRKHTEQNGSLSNAKKGSNNYYLYMPQQGDIDEHFRKSNEHLQETNLDSSTNARVEPNGASRHQVISSNEEDSKSNLLLGRLQSNFIGTEFQIFTPKRRVPKSRIDESGSKQFHSEDELDYDSGFSSDNNTHSRRSRFGRFLRSAGSTTTATGLHSQQQQCNSDSGSVVSTPVVERAKLKRTWSSPEHLQSPSRTARTSRRAIANDAQPSQPQSSNLFLEEEAGAITYTANLLGSRPRIMDVCLPKVTADGVVGREWRNYLESVCGDDENLDDGRSLMLSCFRQLQHRRDNPEPPPPPNEDDTSEAGDGSVDSDFGLLALQNRPPWWNVELGSFVLNFGGRVSVASVKNFQLCERSNQDVIMLQFGRIHGRHSFTMDFRHPLTAVQAFSIAISSLQSKISFG